MDRGRQAAQLEVHVRRLARSVSFALVVLAPARARAQLLQVAARDPAARTVTIVEFQPCVPAETSSCGAWIDRVVDDVADTTTPTMSPALVALRAFDRDSVWIERGAVRIRALAAPARRTYRVRDRRGGAVALAVSAAPRYVFALLHAPPGAAGPRSTIVMIDLDTRSVIDSFASTARFSGITMLQ